MFIIFVIFTQFREKNAFFLRMLYLFAYELFFVIKKKSIWFDLVSYGLPFLLCMCIKKTCKLFRVLFKVKPLWSFKQRSIFNNY